MITSETITAPVSPTPSGIDVIFSSSIIHWLSIAVLAYIAVLWIALILWVTKDITNRTNNVLFQILCISLVIFLTPLFGLVVYLLIRPSHTLSAKYYEEIESEILHSEDPFTCVHCHSKIDLGFTFCPNCGEKNKIQCIGCKKEIPTGWLNCAHCGVKQQEVHHTEEKKHHEKKEPLKKEIEAVDKK